MVKRGERVGPKLPERLAKIKSNDAEDNDVEQGGYGSQYTSEGEEATISEFESVYNDWGNDRGREVLDSQEEMQQIHYYESESEEEIMYLKSGKVPEREKYQY